MHYEIYKSPIGEVIPHETGLQHSQLRKDRFRWRLVADNGKIIAVSSEAYGTRTGCKKSIWLTMDSGRFGRSERHPYRHPHSYYPQATVKDLTLKSHR